MKKTYLCLRCGQYFDLALSADAKAEEQKCPLCSGENVVEHNPMDFLRQLFAGSGGG